MATPGFGGAGLNSVPYLGNAGNLAYQPGPMTTGNNANPWQPFFGEPARELRLNPYAAYGRCACPARGARAWVSLPLTEQRHVT
jgi:hypothetical protein